MTGFHFKAVASDGKLRTGTIHAETDRWVAQELRRQGLTPVYVGIEPKKGWDLKLPSFSRGKRRNVLLFTQNVMHGNIVNREPGTRWSSNCRFKSVFSPYHDKKLGEFFEPILVRPATSIGASYRLPSVA